MFEHLLGVVVLRPPDGLATVRTWIHRPPVAPRSYAASTKCSPSFAALARAGFRAEPIFLAADGVWVVDLRGWSTTPAGLDLTWALAFRIQNDRIAEAINYPGDQHAADNYFWRTYPLAPLPTRLAEPTTE
ncbi:hypothetical protein AB0F43_06730 [Kribbella sp. NPDC023972]|uniref:hypothetical protein n=1 Tax=Kribbella sp. NPDC023972 TaxID=3154795 RepID=UPI0033F42821